MESNRYKVTFLGLVPSMVQQLLAHPMIDQVDFSSVLTFVCVGAYLPRKFAIKLASLSKQAVRFTEGNEFLPLFQRLQQCDPICSLLLSGYGLSECVCRGALESAEKV